MAKAKTKSSRSALSQTAIWIGLGAVCLGLLTWALSLRAENQRLRERLASAGLEVGVEPAAAPEPSGPIPSQPADPSAPEPVDPADPAPDPGAASPLSPGVRQLLVEQLRSASQGERKVWFSAPVGDPRAADMLVALRGAFEEAGWNVERTDFARFPIRPGIFFFMAADEPPAEVTDALAALEAAGLSPTSGRGYRAFYRERKQENPEWNGFEMTDDQSFVVVVGPH